jgi:hypothetical protein
MKRFLVQSTKDEGTSKKGTKRKFDEDYIKYGFVASVKDDSIPTCIVCFNSLANASMVPNKLERHLHLKHPELKEKPKDYFVRLKQNSMNQAKKLKSFTTIPDKAQMASYHIAQMLAKNKKSHLDGESVIIPALTIAAEIMIGHETAEKFKKKYRSRIKQYLVGLAICHKTFMSSLKAIF